MNTADMPTKPHHGRNVKRIREMFGMKQEALAIELGNDWTQRRVSLLEQKEEIDTDVLEEVAKALKVTPEAIKSFDENAAVNIINNIHDNSFENYSNAMVYQMTVNPIEKWVEAIEENKKLYERLLEAEKEKNVLLEKMLSNK